jgi:transposase
MDSDKRSAQVERLQVVDTGRRRRWSEEEKLKIVVESFQGPRQVAARHGDTAFRGRCCCDGGGCFIPSQKGATGTQLGFVPAKLVLDPGVAPDPTGPASSGAIEGRAAQLNQNARWRDLRLMFEIEVKKRGRSRWEWRVMDSSGKAVMWGWEDSRPAARYRGTRALFLLLAHPRRSSENAD